MYLRQYGNFYLCKNVNMPVLVTTYVAYLQIPSKIIEQVDQIL